MLDNNCDGNYNVAYGDCEVMKREKEKQRVKFQSEITNAEAVKMRGGNEGRSSA